ncbi:RNA polymerase sigma factor [Neisseriaceae bacterium CLB008]|nr:sigma-70 family RNA polymerase sigma factor [Neisseriaceae bacterium]
MAINTSVMSLQDWDQFYRTHASWLLALIRRQSGNHHVAQDITQDTFIKAMVLATTKACDSVRDNPRALLKLMAKQIFIDKIRRDVIEKNYWEQLCLAHSEMSEDTVEAHVMVIEALSLLSQTLEACGERMTAIFSLYYFEGLKQQEIAQRLSLSITTVKRDLSQCLMHCYKLRHMLA